MAYNCSKEKAPLFLQHNPSFNTHPMNNFITAIFLLLVSTSSAFTQSDSLKPQNLQLTKGKWEFNVYDTLLEPFVNGNFQGTYRFKRSGELIVTDISFIYYDVTYTSRKGKWNLNGDVLTLDMDDFEHMKSNPKSIQITVLNATTFYSPQADYKTFYWVFRRKK